MAFTKPLTIVRRSAIEANARILAINVQWRRIEVECDAKVEHSHDAPLEPAPIARGYDALILFAAVFAAFGAAIFYMGGLGFPFYKD